MFLVAVVLMMVALILLSLVPLPTTGEDDAEVARSNHEPQASDIQILIVEDTLVHIDDEEAQR